MRVFCALFVFVLWQQAALANVPNQFSVQGVLRAAGQLQSMPFNLTVKLYNDRTSTDAAALLGTPVNAQMVGATNGLFTIAINADQALMTRLTTASQVWLEVTAGNDTFPRQLVTPDVYALMCGNADTVTNGVYTNGSYANPAWITALAGSKITGAVANAT